MRGTANHLVRIGKRITAYDGLEAGAYAIKPVVFETLAKLLQKTVYCTLADAMQQVARSKSRMSNALVRESRQMVEPDGSLENCSSDHTNSRFCLVHVFVVYWCR